MAERLTEVAARFRGRVDEVLANEGPLGGFEFNVFYPGGDEGIFFVKLVRAAEELEISHDTPATIFGVRSKDGLAGLAGTEHLCEKQDGTALSFEVRDADHSFTYYLYCTTRSVRFLSLDKKAVRAQVELELLPDKEVSVYGGELYGDRIEQKGPPPAARTLILDAEGSFAEFQKEHQKFFKSLTALKKFPTELLRVERMDTLVLGGSGAAYEIGFEPLELNGEVSRPYLVLRQGPPLPDVPAQELAGLKLEFAEQDAVHGQIYDLYKGGRPLAEVVSMTFGKVKGKHLDCTLELRIRLAEIANHNPDHRYKDTTCKLKTRIALATGFG